MPELDVSFASLLPRIHRNERALAETAHIALSPPAASGLYWLRLDLGKKEGAYHLVAYSPIGNALYQPNGLKEFGAAWGWREGALERRREGGWEDARGLQMLMIYFDFGSASSPISPWAQPAASPTGLGPARRSSPRWVRRTRKASTLRGRAPLAQRPLFLALARARKPIPAVEAASAEGRQVHAKEK
ncbi:hypothetical protein HWV62_32489 [Athelia sp. TMB]|nr:hypothetical protein HWV62_32489 [Athelia sp. TMB]